MATIGKDSWRPLKGYHFGKDSDNLVVISAGTKETTYLAFFDYVLNQWRSHETGLILDNNATKFIRFTEVPRQPVCN